MLLEIEEEANVSEEFAQYLEKVFNEFLPQDELRFTNCGLNKLLSDEVITMMVCSESSYQILKLLRSIFFFTELEWRTSKDQNVKHENIQGNTEEFMVQFVSRRG